MNYDVAIKSNKFWKDSDYGGLNGRIKGLSLPIQLPIKSNYKQDGIHLKQL